MKKKIQKKKVVKKEIKKAVVETGPKKFVIGDNETIREARYRFVEWLDNESERGEFVMFDYDGNTAVLVNPSRTDIECKQCLDEIINYLPMLGVDKVVFLYDMEDNEDFEGQHRKEKTFNLKITPVRKK